MYGKIFESIYDGTLAVDWKAMITFQQMIILADKDGVVDHTPASLSRRTGIPLEIIEYGVKKLESPDPYSRTPDLEGRRIIRLDDHRQWGWEIVNYEKYRKKASREDQREKARLRQARKRKRDKQAAESKGGNGTVTEDHDPSRTVTDVTTSDTDTDTDNKNKISPSGRVPHQAIVDLYHEHCPMLPTVKVLSEKRKKALRARWKNFVALRGPGKKTGERELIRFDNLDSWERFFKFIAEHCSFMHGNNERQWVANFDFCIRESAMINIMENKYVDRKPK